MDSSTITMIFVLVGLTIMSAYFSATETAFSSLNKIRIKNAATGGDKKAALVLSLIGDYDKLLSTILIGNNIVNIASASIATVIFTTAYGDAGVTISTVVMTILVLIFGEISPKSLAKESPESFAMFSAPILRVFLIGLTPLNYLFLLWKKLLSKVIKVKGNRGITEEELITIVEEATQEGGLDEQESELIRSAIEFNDLDATDILTPRIDIMGVDENESAENLGKLFIESGYSRLPIYRNSMDNIIGAVHLKDFYHHETREISQIIKPVVYTTQSIKISKLLQLLQSEKSHLAVVTDEYGGTLGMVTLEDIIEELVGEIWDEHDEVINEFEQIQPNEYRIACNANLDKMFKLFHIDKDVDASTVSGWVVEELGRIPEVNDTFDYENMHITVTKTDFRRVLEIHIIVTEAEEEQPQK